MQEYVEAILALQARAPAGTELPLAIMTSDDTHERTAAFLRQHDRFGAGPGQITLLKQEKVRANNLLDMWTFTVTNTVVDMLHLETATCNCGWVI